MKEGAFEGKMDGRTDGEAVGDFDGAFVGVSVSGSVGSTMVGDEDGLSLQREKWISGLFQKFCRG